MYNGKISVIIAAYNIAPWIRRSVMSVMGQSYRNLEIILIDDGSTDGTAEIADELGSMDERLVVVHQKNEGLVAVREKGIALASGEYIGFVDGDDEVESDMYELLMNNAIAYDADISHCDIKFSFCDGTVEPHYDTGRIVIQDNFQGQKDLLAGEFIEPSLCNKLYKRELLEGSCASLTVLNNEDMLRNFVIFQKAQRSIYEDFCGYIYHKRDSSISNRSNAVARNKDRICARELIAQLSGEAVKPYAQGSWLSSVVNATNELVGLNDDEAKNLCGECRETLKNNRDMLCNLIVRQRVAARLIMLWPGLHRLVYGLYRRTKGGADRLSAGRKA